MTFVLKIGDSWIQHLIKTARNRKYRNKQLKTIISNTKIIEELGSEICIRAVAVTPEYYKSNKFTQISNVIKDSKMFHVSGDILKAVTREASPEGIIAEIDLPNVFDESTRISVNERVLFLYRISDPGNMGTLMRTALAFECNRIVLIDDCVDPFNPECIKSSMGVALKICIHSLKCEKLTEFIESNSIRTIISDVNTSPTDFPKSNPSKPIRGIILGSESNGYTGFPKELYKKLEKVYIPMSRGVESLNAAFRNLYDNDVTTWSPQGRIFQIEYAAEAVKQGAVCVGICSKDHVVLAALKRSPGELAAFQKKILPIDDHIGIALAGLTSDARVLSKYMQAQALSSRMNMNRPIPVQRLVKDISDKAQINTQQYGGRPFGVGLLVAGIDETGTHLFEFSPTGVFNDYVAMSIGARSQSARTYLEKYVDEFSECSLEDVILHSLKAIRDSLPADSTLTAQNCSFGYLSKNKAFEVIDDEELIQSYLDKLPAVISRSVTVEESAEPSAPTESMMDVDPNEPTEEN